MIGDSGGVGLMVAPTPFAALNVVPGGVGGGRRSMIRFVWFTASRVTIETAATIIAMITGFRRAVSISVNSNRRGKVPTPFCCHAPVPMRAASKNGLTSAPRWPHAWQVNFGSRSDSRTWSGHGASIVTEWAHL